MSRAERLLNLLEALRRHRNPTTGAELASELGISLRTLYRDIATLQSQGARIDGAPGIGYVLRPGFTLPPLMFDSDETEALVLGIRWVAERADSSLRRSAHSALAKIAAVLPSALREELDSSTLLIGPGPAFAGNDEHLRDMRRAIRGERVTRIVYRSAEGDDSERDVWPFAIGFFDRVRMLVAWCELRDGFRHFRVDRLKDLIVTDQRYPRRRHVLLAEWRASQGITTDRN